MPADSHNQYRENAVAQADPLKLVEMMYEGAVRFILRAKKSIADADFEEAHHNILRAYAVVAELLATLDFEHGGEIAANLEQCYDFILHVLKEADIKKDPALLDQVLGLIDPMLATWKEAFDPRLAGGAPEAQQNGNGKPAERKPLDVLG